jgi:hypothetical protein
MEPGQILVVLIMVLGCPIALAWAQSHWEISRQRRRAASMARGGSPTAGPGQRTAPRGLHPARFPTTKSLAADEPTARSLDQRGILWLVERRQLTECRS